MSRTKKYNSSTSQWEYVESVTASGTGAVVSDTTQKLTASSTAPSNPVGGDVWIDTNGKYGADNINFETYRHLGFVSRDNTEFTAGTISDSNWRNIRNTENTADLSISFIASGAKVIVDMTFVIWGASDAYKEMRCLVDGAVVGSVIPASYLLNGVAPGMGSIEFTPAPGSHTMTFQWRKNGGPSMSISYRNFAARAYEIVGGS